MITTVNITTEIPPDRTVTITVPSDVPSGPAEMVVVIATPTHGPTPTLGDLARSEFFGMWRDRADIGDSVEFARRLRAEAWSRPV